MRPILAAFRLVVCYCFGVETVNITPEPFFAFEWYVPPDYKWVEWLDDRGHPVRPSGLAAHPDTSNEIGVKKGTENGPVLTPIEGKHTTIFPMDREHADLFRQFAALDATDAAAILAFARENGWLGISPRASQVRRLDDGSAHLAEGEPQQKWINEVAKMRRAIRLCEHPTARKADERMLLWLFDSHLQDVQGRMRFTADGRGELRIAPLTLLGAMWLQLAIAVAGDKKFVKCRFCDRQIEISTAQSGFRTNRVFCSGPSCKTKDYRRRKRTAIALARRGLTPSAIAKKVATNPKTVQRWLNATRRAK